MSERKQVSRTNWAGLGLFAFGALGTVLMFLAMSTHVPLEERGPLGHVAATWKSVLGTFPSLFFNAALLFLGARLFLKGGTASLGRNVLACAGLALGLAILFGALVPGAGGAIGERTGQVVADRTHETLGALVGLMALFAAAWFGWVRGSSAVLARSAHAVDSESDAAPVSTKNAPRPVARPIPMRATNARSPSARSPSAPEGVTAAESAALFPLEEAAPDTGAPTAGSPILAFTREQPPAPIVTAPIVTVPIVTVPIVSAPIVAAPIVPAPAAEGPRSPYPEDVRRKGQIPPGARPLETPQGAAAASPPPMYRWTAPRIAEQADAEVEETEPVARTPRPLRRVEDDDSDLDGDEGVAHDQIDSPDQELEDLAPPVPLKPVEMAEEHRVEAALVEAELDEAGLQDDWLEEDDFDDEIETGDRRMTEVEAAEPLVGATAPAPAAIPAPSWEQPALFRPEEGDEEPVDAYGTPLTLVEKLRQARRAGGLLRADELDEMDLLDEDQLEEDTPIVHAAAIPRELGDDEFEADEDEEDDLDIEARATGAESEQAEALELTEAELEEAGFVIDSVPPRARAEPAFEPLEPPAVETVVARADTLQPSLFDGISSKAAGALVPQAAGDVASRAAGAVAPKAAGAGEPKVAEPKVAPAAASSKKSAEKSAEKQVTLQPQAPQAPPVAERAAKSPAADMPRHKLLAEIGCLFIERGRVAVSMLQRQYEMDFDDACKALDDLQEMGLIGPYLGGQRRDILLTREQWLERVSQAGATR